MKAYKSGLSEMIRKAVATDRITLQDKLVMHLRHEEGLRPSELPSHLRPDRKRMKEEARMWAHFEEDGFPNDGL